MTVPGVDLTNVQLTLAESQSQLPVTARSSVSGIIPDPELPQHNPGTHHDTHHDTDHDTDIDHNLQVPQEPVTGEP